MNNKKFIEYTSKLELMPDEIETIVFVPESDWNRYKNKIERLKCKGSIWHTIGLLLIGSSLPTAIGAITIPGINILLCLVISGFILIIGIFSLLLAHAKRTTVDTSKDEILDEMKHREPKYKKAIQKEAREKNSFDDSQELNEETLQNFLDFLFPDRAKSPKEDKRALLNEIKRHGETFKTLIEKYKVTKKYLNEIEREVYKGGKKFLQHQIVRQVILDLTNDSYWKDRKENQNSDVVQLKERIRRELINK